MKLAIVGSRTFSNYSLLSEILDSILDISAIVSGGAQGADSLGERYANEHKIPTLIFRPNWEKFGKSAGFIRNKHIVENCDQIIAFWDGKSKGTKHSIDLATKLQKPLRIIKI